MAKDEKDKAATEEAPKKGGKKKLIMILAIVLVALAGGGAGGYFMFAPKKAEAEVLVAGVVVPLDAITINLADGHYLKLKMTLQATDKAAEAPDGSKALDAAISLFSNMDSKELLTNDGREKYKTQLKALVVKAYTVKKEKEIMDVYYTTFVIQ
ncbi:flagellar basal body-associated FliL family protein [Dactylosporangium sp. NPDC050588]|uniref:flagellar basal body-associated FliL family protein n=1 Tax=Dactylosporangium sp. NPDC050588 TaxID=3157211 RepID=UPI0033CF204B